MRCKWAWFLLLLLFAACHPKATDPKTNGVLSQIDVASAFTHTGNVPSLFFTASTYTKVDIDWLTNDFYPRWRKKILDDYGIEKWDDKFQCNGFAFKFYGDMSAEYFKRMSMDKDAPEQLNVGVVFYYRQGNLELPHATNIIVISDTEFVGFEPQTGKVFKFSEEEIKSFYMKCL
jgi:hypothetical protein